MNSANTDEKAFPAVVVYHDQVVYEGGMTLRDYFAAKAMQGLIASRHTDYEGGYYEESSVAETAYLMADAMLKARAA